VAVDYGTLKLVHVMAVTLSFAGFFARGLGMMADASWIRSRAARTVPHVIDTVLLVSAIALAWQLRTSPLNTPWIAAKIVGLVAYVALGTIALRRGRTKGGRAIAWVAGLVTFGYIVSVAITKDPRGILSLLA